jgi:hypothetical protein
MVKNHNGGEWIDHFGPLQIGNTTVYEIWTKTKSGDGSPYASILREGDIPQTRFVLEDEGGKHYFDYFCDLSGYLNRSRRATNAHADLNIGQLIGGLKPAEFWTVLVAIVSVITGAFLLGAKLHSLFGF